MEPRERFRLILAIVEKDLRMPLWTWVLAGSVAGLGFLLSLPGAAAMASYLRYYPYEFVWFDATLRGYYGIAAFLSSVVMGITFATVHGGEVRKGTIRSVILYPIDMTDLTIAKLLATFVIAFLVATPLFMGFFGAYFVYGLYPAGAFLAIHLMAFAMAAVALATGVGASLLIANVTGRLAPSPSSMGALFLIAALLLTETAVSTIGTYLAILMSAGRFPSPETFEAIEDFARTISVVSPHHMGARVLGIGFGLTSLWSDVHVVVPVALLVIAIAYVVGKRLYLDLFIK